jgi:hypothetical protein
LSRELIRILDTEDKAVKEARDPLARLFRQLMADQKINLKAMDDLIRDWLKDPRNNIPDNGKIRSTERGNIIQEITRPNMTMKVFIKRLRLFPIIRVRLILEAEWQNKSITHTVAQVKLNEELDDGEDG